MTAIEELPFPDKMQPRCAPRGYDKFPPFFTVFRFLCSLCSAPSALQERESYRKWLVYFPIRERDCVTEVRNGLSARKDER